MEMIAHGGKTRTGKGPSVAVAKEFVQADQAQGKFKGKAARHAHLKALLKKRKG